MPSPPAWLLGLELTRFAPADDTADALAASLSAIEAGGFSLSPYDGPALQPYAGLAYGALALELAPGAAFHSATATSADGREAAVRTAAARVALRARYSLGAARVGVDAAWASSRATADADLVAAGPTSWELGPTAGLAAPITARLDVIGRVRWPVVWSEGALDHGLSGALALEWHAEHEERAR